MEQIREFLGPNCAVTVRPVVDLANCRPVDGYEVPTRLREVLHLRNPADVFPFATGLGRNVDIDHTVAYLSPARGGPPGQTSMDNLGKLGRFHHRLKTHGRWRLRQPEPGIYLWRSPYGRYYLVNHQGSRMLPAVIGAAAWQASADPRQPSATDIVETNFGIVYEASHAA